MVEKQNQDPLGERKAYRIVISLLSQEFPLTYKPSLKRKREKRKCPGVKLYMAVTPVPSDAKPVP